MGNNEILKEISTNVKNAMSAFNYDFQDRCSEMDIEKYKNDVDDMLRRWPVDQTITESINHTGFPDQVIMTLIEINCGCIVRSIEEFSSINAEWSATEESVGYQLGVTLAQKVNTITIEIPFVKGMVDKCE